MNVIEKNKERSGVELRKNARRKRAGEKGNGGKSSVKIVITKDKMIRQKEGKGGKMLKEEEKKKD